MASVTVTVALAGPPRVNDKLQTCPIVYKSGRKVEAPIPAFFCNISSLRTSIACHGMGLSRHGDIQVRISHSIILQNAPDSENFFIIRNASCAASRAAKRVVDSERSAAAVIWLSKLSS